MDRRIRFIRALHPTTTAQHSLVLHRPTSITDLRALLILNTIRHRAHNHRQTATRLPPLRRDHSIPARKYRHTTQHMPTGHNRHHMSQIIALLALDQTPHPGRLWPGRDKGPHSDLNKALQPLLLCTRHRMRPGLHPLPIKYCTLRKTARLQRPWAL
ncbi:hypothetical protein M406DRAFT_324606 [Cryphonectria parasitica EP155]|uniref:Uncharacterized protein n=1 Tax=Cryphonectria parasitica (strain ATCC 38755 / EP155) TaxID=660469 RepID=A0A9P4XUG9_CRYP1|nr:uncharacterized protein M406DRAFT_324606 [Cryphonectria parasitica EP155]KAF3761022.1 hypothetical protein M406DRAFT_324606 [Cryphonectria parasitica EP155]